MELTYDPEEMLRAKGIDFKRNARGLSFCCFMNPEHQDNNPSAFIYFNTGKYVCFACGFTASNAFMARSLGFSKGKQDRSLESKVLSAWKQIDEVREAVGAETFMPAGFHKLREEYLPLNMTTEIIDRFNIGLCDHGFDQLPLDYPKLCGKCPHRNMIWDSTCHFAQGRYMVPITSEGKNYAVESRLVNKEIQGKKVLYPKDARISETIFNYDRLDRSKPLYVVEGIKGALKVFRYIDQNVTALFSNIVKGRQGKLLAEFKRIILIPDIGPSGEKTVEMVSEIETSTVEIARLPVVSKCRDCGTLHPEKYSGFTCSCGSRDTTYLDVFDFDVDVVKKSIENRESRILADFKKRLNTGRPSLEELNAVS